MTKSKKIVAVFLCACLVIVTVISIILLSNKTKENEYIANTVMTISSVPSVQFVVNDNNHIMAVSANNIEGEYLIAHENFKGLNYEDAIDKFVEICVAAGYINSSANSTGERVSITLDGTLESYTDFQNNVIYRMNRYFDANGIIAVATADIIDDLSSTLCDIYPTVTENFTDKQDKLLQLSKLLYDIDGITKDKYDEFVEQYLQLKSEYISKIAIDSDFFTQFSDMVLELEDYISKNHEISDSVYFPLINLDNATNLDEIKLLLEKYNKISHDLPNDVKQKALSYIKAIEKAVENKKESYTLAKNTFDLQYIECILTLKSECKETIDKQKETISKLIEENKTIVNENREYFLNHRDELEDKIKAFRESL